MGNSIKSKITVTVGIPAYNEEQNIKFLIESLLKQKLENAIFKEIIVISDGSTDKTVEIIKTVKSRLIKLIVHKKRLGQNQVLNQIAQAANSDILVLTDADVIPENELFIQNIIQPLFTSKSVGIAGGDSISQLPRNLLERVISNSHKIKQYMYIRIREGNNVYMCNGKARAFSKEMYTKIVWPDDCPEDAYSYFFCISQGYKFVFNKKATVLFRSPSELKDHANQSNRFIHGKKTLEKYFDPKFVRREYVIPKNLMLKTILFFLLKNPISTPSYMILNMYIRLFKNQEPIHHSKYEVSPTSKRVIV